VVAIDRALAELAAAGAATADPQTQRWTLLPGAQHPLLEAVDLHGAHDFRHSFSTWLEDAGIPARVIDELMGHEASGRTGQQRGSAMGAHYRHTTPEMAARVIEAIQQRLEIVLEVAEQTLQRQLEPVNAQSVLTSASPGAWEAPSDRSEWAGLTGRRA
jgi:Phage integrase family